MRDHDCEICGEDSETARGERVERERLRGLLRAVTSELARAEAENAELRAAVERAVDVAEASNAAMRRLLQARQ